jgi:hypothetical protein
LISLRSFTKEGGFAVFVFVQSEQGRGMKSCEHVRRERAFDELSALQCHSEAGTDERFGGGGAERDDDVRLHRLDLAFDPLVAGVDLALRRGLVQAALAAQLPFEMLDGIGDVEMLAVDAGSLERLIEQPSGGTDERQSLLVFLVAGLLADEHHARVRVAAPNTVCVAFAQSGQSWQRRAAWRSSSRGDLAIGS